MTRWWMPVALVAIVGATTIGLGDEKKPRQARGLYYDVHQATVKRVPGRSSDKDRRLRLLLSVPMGDPGWKLSTKSVGTPDEHGRLRVVLQGKRLPGSWPQTLTHFEHDVDLGKLRVGSYILDIWIDTPIHGPRRAGATMFQAM